MDNNKLAEVIAAAVQQAVKTYLDATNTKEAAPEEPKVPVMLTIKEAADVAHTSYDAVRYKLIAQGKVKYVKVGSRFLVNKDSLVEWMNGGGDCHG